MYNRYRRCCCQNNYNQKVIETICNEAGTTAQFANNMKMHMHMTDDKCECGFDEEYEMSVFPDNPMLAQSYVPWQYMDKTFRPEIGLKMGTIFPELVSPYTPCQSMRTNEFLETTNQIGEGCNNGR